MKLIKRLAAIAITSALLGGCNSQNSNDITPIANDVTIATFNLSFDRNNFEQLVDEMQTSPTEQQTAALTGFQDNYLSIRQHHSLYS